MPLNDALPVRVGTRERVDESEREAEREALPVCVFVREVEAVTVGATELLPLTLFESV